MTKMTRCCGMQWNALTFPDRSLLFFKFIYLMIFLCLSTCTSPLTADANMLWFAIVPLLIASVVGYQCYKHVLNVALEQEQARARARELGVRAVVHTSPSGFIITSSTSQLPSAEASLVSPGSANNYEMATAVVTSKPM
jgi:hypothetical protein